MVFMVGFIIINQSSKFKAAVISCYWHSRMLVMVATATAKLASTHIKVIKHLKV